MAGAVVAAGRSASAVDDATAAAQIAGLAVGVRPSGWALGGSALDAPWGRWARDLGRVDRGWRPT